MENNSKKKICFVVSPIGDEDSDVRKKADELLKYIIEPVCSDCGFKPIRVDHSNLSGSITKEIIDHLLSAELVIADITGHKPNVFFEIGYRTATKKPIIHLKHEGEKIPFDIQDTRIFEYGLSAHKVDVFKKKLKSAIGKFDYSVSEDMKTLGEKIIADAIKQSKPFTKRTLRIVENLSDDEVKLFEEICKFGGDTFPVKDGSILLKNMHILQDCELIEPTTITTTISSFGSNSSRSILTLCKEKYLVVAKSFACGKKLNGVLLFPIFIHSQQFTKAGKELYEALNISCDYEYCCNQLKELNSPSDNHIFSLYKITEIDDKTGEIRCNEIDLLL